jgi:4-carboxymuconolactone decarboxylase
MGTREMHRLAATIIALALLAWGCAQTRLAGAASGAGAPPPASGEESQMIKITRRGTQPSRTGPADRFTGAVRIDPLFEAHDPSHSAGSSVTFAPGARTAWHSHPVGQILIVTAGVGRVQQWGGPMEEIRQGDVVWIPGGVKHWHGAAPTIALTHIGISEQLAGRTVDWLEPVSDAEYRAPVQGQPPTSAQPTTAQRLMGDFAPKLRELTDNVLFGDVWARPDLSPRDRSLVTISALIAMNRPDQLRSHLVRARDNGVTQAEVVEVITHLAFYAGWPSAVTAIAVAKDVFHKQ